MRPWASATSRSSTPVDDLDTLDVAVGTKVVPGPKLRTHWDAWLGDVRVFIDVRRNDATARLDHGKLPMTAESQPTQPASGTDLEISRSNPGTRLRSRQPSTRAAARLSTADS
jgi:hypothetical protein